MKNSKRRQTNELEFQGAALGDQRRIACPHGDGPRQGYPHARARDQVHLAVVAGAEPLAAMHIDLALFRREQARVVEDLCHEA